jgi:hypothetical protein
MATGHAMLVNLYYLNNDLTLLRNDLMLLIQHDLMLLRAFGLVILHTIFLGKLSKANTCTRCVPIFYIFHHGGKYRLQNEIFSATYEQLPAIRNPNFFYILNQAASL